MRVKVVCVWGGPWWGCGGSIWSGDTKTTPDVRRTFGFPSDSSAISKKSTPSIAERKRSKYELEHIVRVHLGRDEPAYRCIFQEPDSQGRMGVALSKDIVHVAAKALMTNLTRLGTMLVGSMVVTAVYWWEAENCTRKVH